MNSMSKIDLDVRKIASMLMIDVWAVERKIAFDLLRSVADRTPIATGRARASWGIGVNTCPNFDVGDGAGRMNPSAASAKAMSNIKGVTKKPPSFVLPPIEVANYVDYVQYLDKGSSKQAPQGIVDLAIADVESSTK